MDVALRADDSILIQFASLVTRSTVILPVLGEIWSTGEYATSLDEILSLRQLMNQKLKKIIYR